jgi:putative ABC transport system permease protein
MGKIMLACRLAARDLQLRKVQALLLLVTIMAATTTLAMGLTLNGVTASPYLRAMAATAGPDAVAWDGPSGPVSAAASGQASRARATPMSSASASATGSP